MEIQNPNFQSDMWSAACTLLKLFTGMSVWGKKGDSNISFIRSEMKKKNLPVAFQIMKGREKPILGNCLTYEPGKRPSAEDLCKTMSKWK